MRIQNHPIWNNISSWKKQAYLAKIFLARNMAHFYPSDTFIGITGSVGKTTTKETCLAVLRQKFFTIATEDNLDPVLNIPEILLSLRPKVKKVILEMGVEYPGEMDFYLSLIRPKTVIITKISFAHSEFLGGLEEISFEKGKLLQFLPKDGLAILNGDDMYCRKIAKGTEAQVFFYGTDHKDCQVWASNTRLENAGTRFELNYGVERVEVNLKLLGRHFIYPSLAAAALGLSLGMSLMSIRRGLEAVSPVEHRLNLSEGPGGSYILDDTYNSSPAAVEEALNVLNELPARRRVVVLGEIRELGAYSEKLHRLIAQKIYKDKFDIVYLGSGETKYIADELLKLGFPSDRLELNLSNSQIVTNILRHVGRGDIVLIKGSRALKLNEIVQRVKK